jgi:heme/copper-type cytochrome/quinol oxidase subunit 3
MSGRADAARHPDQPLRLVRSPRRPTRGTSRGPSVPNSVLGTLVFLGAEVMFFAGLVSAYLVLRAGSVAWPPPDQPRLPVAVTFVNTLVLLASGYTMVCAVAAIRADRRAQLVRWLGVTAALGGLFLLVQGTEWVRLVRYGLHFSSGVYASTFYVVIGSHAVHVLGGVITLLVVLRQAATGRYSARDYGGIEASRLYWLFVVGLWPLLYVLVYLI